MKINIRNNLSKQKTMKISENRRIYLKRRGVSAAKPVGGAAGVAAGGKCLSYLA
jgi:hypothetical protein